jgi:glutaredoxin
MSAQKPRFKLQRPRFIHFVIALLLALLIVERGAAWLFIPKAGSRDIILYTTTWCPYCESLRAHLKAYNIPFQERDVEKSMAGAAGWFALGHGRGVPLSVIGEEVVYGYDMDKINRALRKLGHFIQGPEDTGKVGMDYLSMDTGDAAQATGEAGCARAEEFEAFYAKFKTDRAFKIQRTRFPLRKQVLTGSQPYLTTQEVVEIEKHQVVTEQEPVYLDHEILETGGYTLQIQKNGEQVDVTAGPPEGAEPLTIHKFHRESGCWFLTEYVSYEYFGSLMILSSV